MFSKAVHLLILLTLILVSVGPGRPVAASGLDSDAASPASPVLPGDPSDPARRGSESIWNPSAIDNRTRPVCTSSSWAEDGPRVLRQEEGVVAEQFKALLLSSDQLEEFQTSVEKKYGHQFNFQSQESYVLSYGSLVGAYIPISGGAGHSFYTMWFDRTSRQVVETAAVLFRLDSNANIQARVESGSGLVMDAVLTQGGQVVDGAIQVDGQTIPLDTLDTASPTGFWSCFLECLGNDPQVPAWLRVAIDIVCGIVCLVSTPGCIICAIIQGGILVVPCIRQCGGTVHSVYLPMTANVSPQ